MDSRVCWFTLALVLAGCAGREATPSAVDAGLADEIAKIRAIDNHAHPVRASAAGEAPDREFDALPVDNMEAATDPWFLRPDAPGLSDAWKALYSSSQIADKQQARARKIAEKGPDYPNWVLDQMGVDVMLANRVVMGTGVAPPRFRWVPYADALIFPLDNSGLAAANSDRRSFFALEDVLRKRYVGDSPLPSTLADYLTRV